MTSVKALLGDTKFAAYVRWGALIFSIGVSWANLKGDVKQIARDQEAASAVQAQTNDRFQKFIEGNAEQREYLAGWYERLYQNEKAVAELQYEVALLTKRQTRAAHQSSYRQPIILRSRPQGRSEDGPAWRRDPRRNPAQ